MSNLGAIASRFDINSKSLKEFDSSLRLLKRKKDELDKSEFEDVIGKILRVVKPISEGINDNLSNLTNVSENNIIIILHERHERNWSKYRNEILELSNKLSTKKKIVLSKEDFELLDDIADALDTECEYLYQRLSDRR